MRIILTLTCFLAFTAAFSQTKMLSMEDAVLGQRTYLAPKRLPQLGWIPGTDKYYYIGGDKKDQLVTGDAATGKEEVAFTLKAVNATAGKDSFPSFPLVKWITGTKFRVEGKRSYEFDIAAKNKAGVAGDTVVRRENADEDPSLRSIAYTKENNLFIYSPSTHKDVQVTNDADKAIVNGQSVHREEWGIFKGTFWSPKGNLLAFYRMDQTMVTDYPVMNLGDHPATVTEIKYPMAGAASHHVTVGIYDIKSGKTVFLKTGEPKDHFLINPVWSPDEKHVYLSILNREQNHLWYNCYNASTGELERTLFEETSNKYVHPMHPALFVKNNPGQFIWQSERDGYNNLYLYQIDGTLIRQLTNYAAPNVKRAYYTLVMDVIGFDEQGKYVYYVAATSKNIIGRELRAAALDGSYDEALVSGEGTHAISMSGSGKYFIDSYSAVNVPRIVSIIDNKGKTKKTLLTAPDPLKDYKLGQMRLFTMKAADNSTDLYCRMILPVDFDSTKKYPAIVYLYNGPGIQLITNTWLAGADLWYQYMAEHGYIVFTVDGRGSGNRGLAFEQVTFRNLGKAEMDDQLKGVDFLKSKSYVDASRLGVFGWSFGGFMTTSLMTRHGGVFKCGVAGGPVIDWSYYEVMYTERYMDTPKENPEGYKETSLLNYAQDLNGKLLIIHGTSDPVVVWQHSLLFLEKCVAKGTYPDYLVYPGHEHNVTGKDRAHLFYKITEYFEKNL